MKLIGRQQLTEQVISHLQGQIASGQLPLGVRLPPEAQLMEQLGVGRSTLREAVRALAHTGFLEVRQGDGTYVRNNRHRDETIEQRLARAEMLEVYEVRHILELGIARLAAKNRTDDDLARMRECLTVRDVADRNCDRRAFLDADLRFHQAVADATKNAVLAELYMSFSRAILDASTAVVADRAVDRSNQRCWHQQLLEAIARRDENGAERIAAEILDSVMDQLGELLR
jgi:DNA-binding FadR family transcriptional regulator